MCIRDSDEDAYLMVCQSLPEAQEDFEEEDSVDE